MGLVTNSDGEYAILSDIQGIEDHLVFDLSGQLSVGSRYKLHVQVRNLFDEVYVAARRPYGLRPGLPRTAMVGLSVNF